MKTYHPNCRPVTACGPNAEPGTLWTCTCGKTWRKGDYGGWDLALPWPACESGYTEDQLEIILGPRIDVFWAWMNGQTIAICTGRKYNHNLKQYEESCNGVAHDTVVYPWDLQRFLEGRPVID